MEPGLSVVMPVYNQEGYLSAAIRSVLNQTFRDFELIIVDDGSTDGTREILSSQSDPRIRIIDRNHGGVCRAVEAGIVASRARWVARMDSDDICHPKRFERQMAFLTSNSGCVLAASVYGVITPNYMFLVPRETFGWTPYEARDITRNDRLFADPSVVFDRRTALGVGMYDPDFNYEKPLWYRLLRAGRGALFGDPLYFWRQRLGSSSTGGLMRPHVHGRARLRYDPDNANRVDGAAVPAPVEEVVLRAALRCQDLYLVAGDRSAALEVALGVLRRWPLRRRTIKMVLRGVLGTRSLRFWKPPVAHPYFKSIGTPEWAQTYATA